jgi:hypothetical protein
VNPLPFETVVPARRRRRSSFNPSPQQQSRSRQDSFPNHLTRGLLDFLNEDDDSEDRLELRRVQSEPHAAAAEQSQPFEARGPHGTVSSSEDDDSSSEPLAPGNNVHHGPALDDGERHDTIMVNLLKRLKSDPTPLPKPASMQQQPAAPLDQLRQSLPEE